MYVNIGNRYWFQQDDTTCHTAEATLDVLRPAFEDCNISRRRDPLFEFRKSFPYKIAYYIVCTMEIKNKILPTLWLQRI